MATNNYPTYKYTEEDARKQLARFEKLDSPDNYPFDSLHAHEYNEILVFTTGGGYHNINNKNYKVETNAIHVVAAQDIHWLERSIKSNGFVIVYKDQFLHKLQMVHPDIDFYDAFNNSRVINLNKSEAESFKFIFKELLDNQTPCAYQLQIIGAFITKIASLNSIENKSEKIYDALIPKVLQLIDSNFKTHKTIDQYATLLNISGRTLQSRIKKAFAYTLGELIQERTLKEAKKLLCISEMNVKEIAYELGFKDTSHFTNWFKKKTGILPTEFKSES